VAWHEAGSDTVSEEGFEIDNLRHNLRHDLHAQPQLACSQGSLAGGPTGGGAEARREP